MSKSRKGLEARGNRVQSVLIPKKYSVAESKQWLKDNGFKFIKVHTTKTYHRFRQFSPKKGGNYYSLKLKNGIILVIQD